MRLVNLAGRGGLLVDEMVFDVETLSGGQLPSDPMSLLSRWHDLVDVAGRGAFDGGVVLADVRLGPPLPRPPMIFSVVANFPPVPRPVFPMVVGKSPSAITGPFDDVVLPDPAPLPLGQARVIPEPELGVVMRGGRRHLPVEDAGDAIAGFLVAQDITERRHEFGPAPAPWTWDNLPAKTLGKSIDTFCPTGPSLVTLEELANPDDLMTRCWINNQLRFEHSTADMLWSVAELVSLLSDFMTPVPGVICLCGSPGTVDGASLPFLSPGDRIHTSIDGLGAIINTCVTEAEIGRRS